MKSCFESQNGKNIAGILFIGISIILVFDLLSLKWVILFLSIYNLIFGFFGWVKVINAYKAETEFNWINAGFVSFIMVLSGIFLLIACIFKWNSLDGS